MDKKYIGLGCLGAVILVVLVVFFWVKGAYNGMVVARENGKEAFSQIDIVLKRNFQDLNSLDNILGREEELIRGTLKDVTDARARATSITIDPSNCTPEQMKAWNQAQGDFTQALGRLMVADENYPELRDLQAFQDETSCRAPLTASPKHADSITRRPRFTMSRCSRSPTTSSQACSASSPCSTMRHLPALRNRPPTSAESKSQQWTTVPAEAV